MFVSAPGASLNHLIIHLGLSGARGPRTEIWRVLLWLLNGFLVELQRWDGALIITQTAEAGGLGQHDEVKVRFCSAVNQTSQAKVGGPKEHLYQH